ncbi:MAG TPA: hypothetical protein PLC42_01405 [Parachlamydiaceae bacterium]|nr:hypothetical protein [Parachlamydiaceae bacterium]
MNKYALKIYQKICAKIANFSNQSVFQKKFFKKIDSQKNSLYPHEWIVISSLIFLLVLLTFVSHSCDPSFPETKKEVHYLKAKEFEVFIEGEVEFPGKHHAKSSSKIGDLLLLAKPKASADLRRIKTEKTVRKGQIIKVPAYQMIKIILKFNDGSVEELSVPKGTKWEDLPKFYEWPSLADLSFLAKKKRLKEGDQIKIKFNR